MLVVMIVFSLIMGIITAGIVSMLRQQNRQSAIATDMDSARKLVQLLDRQVRYANAITAPGTGTDGNTYFEWRTGNKGQQQTCTQWRYVSSLQRIETRSWQPPLAGNGAVTPTSWTVAVPGIKTNGANPLFSLAAPSALGTHETLTVNYAATSGGPAVSSSSQI
ncbi:MAG: hypothetical protein JO222_07125, partial [Frankiales bacterium]|nr:hypothetical protein [Frankiales bacterium]